MSRKFVLGSLACAGLAAHLVPSTGQACEPPKIVQQNIALLESAVDLTDRLRASSVLAGYAKSPRSEMKDLDDSEWAQVVAGGNAWDAAQQRAVEFEANMSVAYLENATSGETTTLARAVNRLYLASKASCSEADFKRLEKGVGLSRLAILYRPIARIAYLEESPHGRERSFALAHSLAAEEDQEPGATELAAFYRVQAENWTPFAEDPERRKQIDKEKKTIRANRVKKEDVDKTVLDFARLAPGCFVASGSGLDEHIDQAVTRARGAYLLEMLKEQLEQGDRPADAHDFTMPEDASPLEARHDSFYEDFRIRYEGGKATLYSFGPDRKNATDDDIVIGTVPVPSKR